MPFPSLTFKHSWRPYQKRVLDAIDAHLSDDRLHIVAAPGAGKTTLGLEVFKRLEKPALVLSPTRVIRDQWVSRLSDFIDVDDISSLEWVSKALDKPKILTSITYQALHSKLRETIVDDEAEQAPEQIDVEDEAGLADPVSSGELENLIRVLKTSKIGVIILDEAHHLRSEWWKALDKVCTEVPEIVLVSLTATPPYDSRDHEWSRYEALCGPIDEEISIPELVKMDTLCAHQDYIWAVDASSTEKSKIKEHDERVTILCNTLFDSDEFMAIVRAHPWLGEGNNELERDLIKQPDIAMAMLSFLKAKAHTLPQALIRALDLNLDDVPELGRRAWQILVEAVLFSNTFKHSDNHKESVGQLKKQLRASELLFKRELSLERSRRLNRSLSQSISKVSACCDIHALEYEARGVGLRQVILTDYIRDEALVTGIDTGDINLGAWPIFNSLLQTSAIPSKAGLLTGRLSIVHESLLETLQDVIGPASVKAEPVALLGGWFKVDAPLNHLTRGFTQLLIDGHLNVLIGTRALLGEGWDAPVVNSLVLASSVGSFMLTNQMRGRAIRIDKQRPEKVSSIWHLVAIDHKSSYSGWGDFYDLSNRFETFVGLSEKNTTIESGFERLEAKAFSAQLQKMDPRSPVARNNREMVARFKQFHTLKERWQKALTLNEVARVIPSVKTPTVPRLKAFHVSNTLKYLLLQLGAILSIAGYFSLNFIGNNFANFWVIVMVIFSGAAIIALPKTIAALQVLFKHLPVDGSLKQIGLALAHALNQAGMIETSYRRIKVVSTQQSDGTYYIAIKGCSFYESSLFADCLREVLGPIDSPRYLITRTGAFMGLQRDDFHSVPIKLGVKKEYAQIFYQAWCRYVGPTELIYTRSDEGRARLLKAKIKAFSATYQKKVKRQDRWQ